MIRHAAPRLGAYPSLAALFLVLALALGRPELVTIAAPFALTLVAGLSMSDRPRWIRRSVSVDRERVVEGETVTIRVEIGAAETVERLDVVLPLPPGLVAEDWRALRSVRLSGGETRCIDVPVRCERWGAFVVGDVLLRAHDRLDLFRFDDRVDARLSIKVFPRSEMLREVVGPSQTQMFAGDQVARQTGEGIEFAELRPFVTGDVVRSIDWKATARKGSTWVRDRRPERNADVVIFLDAYSDVSTGAASSTLDRAVRAAAAVAGVYLRRRDRVGVVSFGGELRWLEPALGSRQLYRIIDALLDTQIAVSYAWKGINAIPVRTLPPNAVIVALSPLLDERSVSAIFDLRGRGFDVALVEVSPGPPVPRQAPARLAHRMWVLERQVLRQRLQRIGVAVSEWREDEALQRPFWEVESFRRTARLVRA